MDKGFNNKSRHTMDERKHVRWANDWYAYNAIFVWRDFKIKSHYHLSIKAWKHVTCIFVRLCGHWPLSFAFGIVTFDNKVCIQTFWRLHFNAAVIWPSLRCGTNEINIGFLRWCQANTQACSCTINSCRINYVEWNISIGLI